MARSGLGDRSNGFRELDAQQERIRLTLAATEIGTFDHDLSSDTLLWDDKCRELFGVPLGVPVSYQATFLEALHPEDRDQTLHELARFLDVGIRDVPDAPFEIKYRAIGVGDGVVRTILARARRIRMPDDSLHVIGIVALMPDETASKSFVVRGRGTDGPDVASRGRAASALVLARRWSEAGIRGITVTEPGGLPLCLDVFRARFFPRSATPRSERA